MTGVLHIAVCDPNAGHRAALCDALAKLLFDTVDYRFACFAGGEELLAALEGGAACQLVFLEVRLGGALNGLETAGLLRYRAPQADIIFLTRLAEHIGDGYRYHAFDFLIKPVPMARLQETVDRYLEERRQRPADYLKVSIQRRSVQLPLRQILCLESRRRKVVAHMTGDQVVFYGRLDALEELLAPSGFLRCHQSYLVNKRYIRQLDSTSLTLAGGAALPVSRPHLKALRALLQPQTPAAADAVDAH